MTDKIVCKECGAELADESQKFCVACAAPIRARSFLSKQRLAYLLFSFRGRIGRREYALGHIVLFVALVGFRGVIGVQTWLQSVIPYPDMVISVSGFVLSMPVIYSVLALAAKRAHDRNHSGWILLLGWGPIVNVGLIIYLLLTPSRSATTDQLQCDKCGVELDQMDKFCGACAAPIRGRSLKRLVHLYFSFRGRIGRLEYFLGSILLLVALVGFLGVNWVGVMLPYLNVALLIDLFIHEPGVLVFLTSIGPSVGFLAVFIISPFALAVKRAHDRNHSGWILLILLVPLVGSLLHIYLLFAPSRSESPIGVFMDHQLSKGISRRDR